MVIPNIDDLILYTQQDAFYKVYVNIPIFVSVVITYIAVVHIVLFLPPC
jgi:hypothetical protein